MKCITTEDTKVKHKNIATIYNDNKKWDVCTKVIKMPSLMARVQRQSGLIKVEASASTFRRRYLG
jgi:hypothetical protein